jgi:hypothetical protein
MIKFHYSKASEAIKFCEIHGLPLAAIRTFKCGRCEVSVSADIAREIRFSLV